MRAQPHRLGMALAAVVASWCGTLTAVHAQSEPAGGPANAARIEFDHPGGGTPAVDLALPAGLLGDVVGLGDAAIAGIAEAIQSAPAGSESMQADVKLATEQLAAIRTIVASVQGAVGEVRVRVYANSDGMDIDSLVSHYDAKLTGSAWAKIVHAQENEQNATVYLMRDDGAIRGVFIVATEGRELALVNVLCDVSPERIKQITKQAASIGLELGGEDALREIVGKIRGRHAHRAMVAPAATVSDAAHVRP